jgi:hypothetical protein
MKIFSTLFALLTLAVASAQPIADRTETNCDGESRSVYEVTGTGQSIIVASKGFDCSICISQADNVAAFANDNIGVVQVWGAMRYTYSSATPDCDDVNNWDNTHAWSNVFSFPDPSGYWSGNGTPFYQVIDPTTLEIAYSGSNFTNASLTALGLTTLSTADIIREEGLSINGDGEYLNVQFWGNKTGQAQMDVYNIVGQKIEHYPFEVNAGANVFALPFPAKDGIYIANISLSNGQKIALKFMSYK